jgi:hypothetical protein
MLVRQRMIEANQQALYLQLSFWFGIMVQHQIFSIFFLF